ncbi:MAG: hypothetical protein KGJ62_14580 [Armatimonadetes bacterium]|nr:hypothetical protein [Armatimonadota bacterium]MDE2207288.1 hypothetical protein [Armatimonadota bacterium]
MPIFDQLKKGEARVRILPPDTMGGFAVLMQLTGGKLQVLPQDLYVVEAKILPMLRERKIAFEEVTFGAPQAPDGETQK